MRFKRTSFNTSHRMSGGEFKSEGKPVVEVKLRGESANP